MLANGIYNLIRSEEVREHARKYWELSPEDRVLLVHLSFYPLQEKYEILKDLAESIPEGDAKRYAENFVKVYKLVLEHIMRPKERVLYLCELSRPAEKLYRDEADKVRCGYDDDDYMFRDWYDSYKELIDSEITPYEPMEPGYRYSVYVVSVPASGPSDQKVHFFMDHIDGKTEISAFCACDKWLKESGISDAVIYDLFNGGNGGRHSYPFADFSSVLLQTPLMEEPLKCTLHSVLDGNYCWYQFLYPRLAEVPEYPDWRELNKMQDSWNIDMSYRLVNLTGGYNTFDWIRSDSEADDSNPGNLERIKRSWENIQNMIHWRDETRTDNKAVAQVSHRLWPSHMEEEPEDGIPVKVLWIKEGKSSLSQYDDTSDDGKIRSEDLNAIAEARTDLFEDAIERICHIRVRVKFIETKA